SRQAAVSRQFARAVMELLLAVALADDAEGEPRGTAAPHQPGHLMPVEAVGVDLGHRPGDTQSLELRRAPVVHGRFVMADGFLAGGGRFHRSSFSGARLMLDGAGAALPGESDPHRMLCPVACMRASRWAG